MTETVQNPLPGLLRRLFLSWLLAVDMEYLLLPFSLRALGNTEGLAQMSLARVAILAAVLTLLLTVAARYLPTEQAERWGLLTVYLCLAVLSLTANFSVPFLLVCLLGAVGLVFYTVLGWQPDQAPRQAEEGRKIWLWAAAGLSIGFFLLVSVWTVYRYKTFNSPAYDFGIFAQMFHSMKTTGLPMTTVERDGLLSHFWVHMSPIYYLMLPFYCLVPRPETLQVLQAAVMASAVIPLWKLGRHHGLSRLQRFLLCAVLLLVPAFAGGAAYDLHENCFLTPLLLWLLYGLDSRNIPLTAVAALLTLCVKEDAAVYVAIIALYLLLRAALRYSRESRWDVICGAVLLGTALIWFFVVTGFLATVGDGVMTSRYSNYMYDGSSSLITVVKAVVLSPMKAVFECVDKEKLYFIGMTMCPMLGLPLLTRRYERYVLLMPWLLLNLMTDYPYQYDIYFQYAYGSLACLIYLTAINLAQLKVRRERTVALLGAAAVALLCFHQTAWAKATYFPELYENYEDTYTAYQKALSHVPPDASVTASTFFVAPLAQREIIYSLPHTTVENLLSTRCVVLKTSYTDEFHKFQTDGQLNGCENLLTLLKENGYELIATDGSTLQIYLRP